MPSDVSISEASALDTKGQQLGRVPSGLAKYALLSLRSRSTAPCAMDELTFLLSILQESLGQDAEIVFGHDETTEANAPELQLWLLVEYAAITAAQVP
jgi:hypothetical protein